MATFTLPEEYGWVLMGMMGSAVHCFFQGAMTGRDKYMSEEWVRKNLKEENEVFKKRFGYEISKGAYPEMVDGRHAAKLEYREWLEYACCQRAHGNYMEVLPLNLLLMGIAGLKYPLLTAALSCVFIVARQLYSSGYRNNGPGGRLRGAIPGILTTLTLLCLAAHSAFSLTSLGR